MYCVCVKTLPSRSPSRRMVPARPSPFYTLSVWIPDSYLNGSKTPASLNALFLWRQPGHFPQCSLPSSWQLQVSSNGTPSLDAIDTTDALSILLRGLQMVSLRDSSLSDPL